MYTKETIFPMYVGKCEIKFKNGTESQIKNGKMEHGVIRYDVSDRYQGIDLYSKTVNIYFVEESGDIPISDCTLLLKPLSKMSEEDAIAFCCLELDREYPKNDFHVIRHNTSIEVELNNNWYSYRFFIGNNGNIWKIDNGINRVHKQVEITLWLINHGYAISDELFELKIAEEV